MTGLPLLLAAAEDVRLAARVDLPVLITAASGARRDVYARIIHLLGARGAGPFVPLFDRSGAPEHPHTADGPPSDEGLRRRIHAARGGTLFIDDILSVTPAARRLIAALVESHVSAEIAAGGRRDVRLVTGASRRIDPDGTADLLRDPLFYRLNAVHIDLLGEEAETDIEATAPDVRWNLPGFRAPS